MIVGYLGRAETSSAIVGAFAEEAVVVPLEELRPGADPVAVIRDSAEFAARAARAAESFGAFAIDASAAIDALPSGDAGGQDDPVAWYRVEIVIREGRMLPNAVDLVGTSVIEGVRRPSRAISLESGEIRTRILDFARSAVGYQKLGTGLYTLRAELLPGASAPRLIDLQPGRGSLVAAPDAYFAAFGWSPQHLLTEAVLRPAEFERRLLHAPRSPRTLAVAAVQAPAAQADVVLGGLRLARRLPGFHSLEVIDGDREKGGVPTVLVSFVGDDRPLVASSLEVILEMGASQAFFIENEVVSLDPTLRA